MNVLLFILVCCTFCLVTNNLIFAESEDYVTLESAGEEILLPVISVDENYVYVIVDSSDI